jgi:hypothetical protein
MKYVCFPFPRERVVLVDVVAVVVCDAVPASLRCHR